MASHPKRKKVAGLEDHLGYWLRALSNRVSGAFQARLADHDVSIAQWVVLRELWDQRAMAPSMLAQRLGLTRGAMSKIVDRLVERSLVQRSVDAEDRRYQVIELSPEGRALVPTLAAVADENDHAFFSAISSEEQAALMAMLRRLAQVHGIVEAPID